MNKPLVSVIVPTHNRGNFIRDTIESVLSQTYQNWELIIIDDGSTDNTQDIVKNFSSKKIKYIHLNHVGRSSARNHGLKLSKGEFIAYLDSDDVFLPTKLEKQVCLMVKNPQTAMVYTSALIINDDGNFFPMLYSAPISGQIYKKVGMFIPVTILLPTVMIRKSIQDLVGGFDEELNRFEDTDMWRRVSRDFSIDAFSEPLVKVRTHSENQLSSLDPKQLYEDIKKYIKKVEHEDRNGNRWVVAKGSARLFLHYAISFYQFPHLRKWTVKSLIQAFLYHPCYTLVSLMTTLIILALNHWDLRDTNLLN